jgi:hypothetical protein
MKLLAYSFLLGVTLGVVTTSWVLARSDGTTNTSFEWCFREQFDSPEQLELFRKTASEEFSLVKVEPNGTKLWVFTKCDQTPLPHRQTPYS